MLFGVATELEQDLRNDTSRQPWLSRSNKLRSGKSVWWCRIAPGVTKLRLWMKMKNSASYYVYQDGRETGH